MGQFPIRGLGWMALVAQPAKSLSIVQLLEYSVSEANTGSRNWPFPIPYSLAPSLT